MASSSFKVLPSPGSLGSFNQTAESQEYAVEKILDMKIIDDQVYYLIKWEGYPESESTWEPIEHLSNIIHLVEEFRERRLTKAPLSIPDNISSIPHGVQKSQYSQKAAKFSQSPLLKELQSETGTIHKKRKISSQSVHKPSQSQTQSEVVMEVENSNSQKVSSSEYDLFEAGVTVKGGRSVTESFDTTNKTFSKALNSFKTTQEILEGLRKENKLEKTRKSRLLYPDNHKVQKIHLINEEGNTVTDYSYKSSADSDNTQQTRSQVVEGSLGGVQVLKSLSLSQDQKTQGSLSVHDKPRKIITIKQRKKGAGFWFLVEWEERRNGFKPQNSYVSNEELKETDPKFLLNFYESKIVVFPKNELLDDVENSQEPEPKSSNENGNENEDPEDQPKQKKKVILTNSNKKNRKK